MTKRALLLVVLVVSLVAMFSNVALAQDPTSTVNTIDPTYVEQGGGEWADGPSALPAGSPGYGSSAWTYTDAAGAAKTEGSYRAFDDQVNMKYSSGVDGKGPHGGYSTTSNKCKVCHAVHRATGSFALLRVDNPDDACAYCHIGGHRHATKQAYFNSTGDTIYAANGHTIGAGMEIPDSSIWQWTETVTLTGADGATGSYPVRRYMEQRNKIMRYTVHSTRFIRVGPNYLRCASCHQVHNATRQIWQPQWSGVAGSPTGGAAVKGDKMTQGYKLLRNAPAGNIAVNMGSDEPTAGTIDVPLTLSTSSSFASTRKASRRHAYGFDPSYATADMPSGHQEYDYRIKAVETSIALATGDKAASPGTKATGTNVTGYTTWEYFASTNTDAQTATDTDVYETSMAFWCADCHNLNIAGKQQVAGFGTGKGNDSMLADRSHAIPNQFRNTVNTLRAGGQCYACHNNDMPLDAKTDGCGGCHIGPTQYHMYKNGATSSGYTWESRNNESSVSVDGQLTNTYFTDNLVNGKPRSDFPHSGPDIGQKLLSAVDRMGVTTGDLAITGNASLYRASTDATWYAEVGGLYRDEQGKALVNGKGLDHQCKTCHGGYKTREIGVDK